MGYTWGMKKSDSMPEVIRAAIQADPRTVYRLCQESGIDPAVLGRFVRRERGLNLETADRICHVLGLTLCPTRRR